jgi:hypothetical protein
VDVKELVAELFQVFVPSVIAPLQLGVSTIQVELKQRYFAQDFDDHFQLIVTTERDWF